jgi:WD40-like Beta Propeller Repeat
MTRRSGRVRLGGLALLVVLAILVPQQVETAKKFSAWSAPVNLGPVVNSAFEEFLPEMSKNELSLYFASNRPGPFGGEDLWVSRRATRNDDWGEPLNLGPNVNTSFNERSPALSRDGHFLFFTTTRPGGSGAFDIWVSWRAHTRDDFGWQPPVNLGPGVNGAFGDFGPTFFENDDIGIPNLFFASSRPGVGGIDIYRSELLASGSFGPALLIPELSTPQNDFRPTIRPDGLEVFFDSNRPGPPDVSGIGLRDLWVSTRETTSNAWSTPVNLGPAVNTEFNDTLPALSSDGMTLIFTSDRPGFGGSDLYMSARARED